jgi:hypothetical protein
LQRVDCATQICLATRDSSGPLGTNPQKLTGESRMLFDNSK